MFTILRLNNINLTMKIINLVLFGSEFLHLTYTVEIRESIPSESLKALKAGSSFDCNSYLDLVNTRDLFTYTSFEDHLLQEFLQSSRVIERGSNAVRKEWLLKGVSSNDSAKANNNKSGYDGGRNASIGKLYVADLLWYGDSDYTKVILREIMHRTILEGVSMRVLGSEMLRELEIEKVEFSVGLLSKYAQDFFSFFDRERRATLLTNNLDRFFGTMAQELRNPRSFFQGDGSLGAGEAEPPESAVYSESLDDFKPNFPSQDALLNQILIYIDQRSPTMVDLRVHDLEFLRNIALRGIADARWRDQGEGSKECLPTAEGDNESRILNLTTSNSHPSLSLLSEVSGGGTVSNPNQSLDRRRSCFLSRFLRRVIVSEGICAKLVHPLLELVVQNVKPTYHGSELWHWQRKRGKFLVSHDELLWNIQLQVRNMFLVLREDRQKLNSGKGPPPSNSQLVSSDSSTGRANYRGDVNFRVRKSALISGSDLDSSSSGGSSEDDDFFVLTATGLVEHENQAVYSELSSQLPHVYKVFLPSERLTQSSKVDGFFTGVSNKRIIQAARDDSELLLDQPRAASILYSPRLGLSPNLLRATASGLAFVAKQRRLSRFKRCMIREILLFEVEVDFNKNKFGRDNHKWDDEKYLADPTKPDYAYAAEIFSGTLLPHDRLRILERNGVVDGSVKSEALSNARFLSSEVCISSDEENIVLVRSDAAEDSESLLNWSVQRCCLTMDAEEVGAARLLKSAWKRYAFSQKELDSESQLQLGPTLTSRKFLERLERLEKVEFEQDAHPSANSFPQFFASIWNGFEPGVSRLASRLNFVKLSIWLQFYIAYKSTSAGDEIGLDLDDFNKEFPPSDPLNSCVFHRVLENVFVYSKNSTAVRFRRESVLPSSEQDSQSEIGSDLSYRTHLSPLAREVRDSIPGGSFLSVWIDTPFWAIIDDLSAASEIPGIRSQITNITLPAFKKKTMFRNYSPSYIRTLNQELRQRMTSSKSNSGKAESAEFSSSDLAHARFQENQALLLKSDLEADNKFHRGRVIARNTFVKHEQFDLPNLPISYSVLRQRDIISNGNRLHHSVFCPMELGEIFQQRGQALIPQALTQNWKALRQEKEEIGNPIVNLDFRVDYFFEIGGYTGDCAVIASYFNFAKKGVIAVDGSQEATESLQKTMNELKRVKPSTTYLHHASSGFISDKVGFYRPKESKLSSRAVAGSGTSVNKFQSVRWEQCPESESNNCTHFITVDSFLQNQIFRDVNANFSSDSIGLRVKISGDEDDLIRGMRESLRKNVDVMARKNVDYYFKWIHFTVTKWCGVSKRMDCFAHIKEVLENFGYKILWLQKNIEAFTRGGLLLDFFAVSMAHL